MLYLYSLVLEYVWVIQYILLYVLFVQMSKVDSKLCLMFSDAEVPMDIYKYSQGMLNGI